MARGSLGGLLERFGSLGLRGLAKGRRPSARGMGHLEPDLLTLVVAAGQDVVSAEAAQLPMTSAHALGRLVSFEMIAANREILCQLVVPRRAAGVMERQLVVAYPTCQVIRGWDPLSSSIGEARGANYVFALEYVQWRPYFYPMATWSDLRRFDPLQSILEAMTYLEGDEILALQLLVVPADASWGEKGLEWAANPGPGVDRQIERAIRQKLVSPLFKVVLRTAAIGPDLARLTAYSRGLDVALAQFGQGQPNGFVRTVPATRDAEEIVSSVVVRQALGKRAMILSAAELANVWHLPGPAVEVQGFRRARGRVAAPSRGVVDNAIAVPLGFSDCRPRR